MTNVHHRHSLSSHASLHQQLHPLIHCPQRTVVTLCLNLKPLTWINNTLKHPHHCLYDTTRILYNSLRSLVLSTISFTSSTISSTSFKVQTRSWMLSKACGQWNMKTKQWLTLRPLRRKHLILTTFPVAGSSTTDVTNLNTDVYPSAANDKWPDTIFLPCLYGPPWYGIVNGMINDQWNCQWNDQWSMELSMISGMINGIINGIVNDHRNDQRSMELSMEWSMDLLTSV